MVNGALKIAGGICLVAMFNDFSLAGDVVGNAADVGKKAFGFVMEHAL